MAAISRSQMAEAARPLLTRLGDAFAEFTPPVVVACSGGTDSLALLVLAAVAALDPTAVHVDHGARVGSAREAERVFELAEAFGTGFAAERVTIPPGPGFEARAREARYEALERARAQVRATAVLVGHTRDDQAETVLLNLLRGGAVSGLAGIPPRRGRIGRPLLSVPRLELAEVCAKLRIVPVDDPMNADPIHRRVWLRREVIPALEQGTGRDLRPVLARQAEVARADSELLDRLAGEALADAGDPPAADDLAGLDPALGRRAVRAWLGPPPPPFEHVEGVLDVAAGRRRSIDLPGGVRVARSGGRLHRMATPREVVASPPEAVPVDLPGTATGFGLRLEAWVERAPPLRWPDGRWTAVLDADLAGERAWLRPARPGERFTPLGLGGHKPVLEALAEAGVPAEARQSHPLLAGAHGEPLWVVGYRIDDRVRVRGETRRFLWVTTESGGSRA